MQIILNTKDITNKTLYIDIAKNIIYNNLNSFISNLLLLKKIYVSEDFIKTLIKPKLKENYNDYKEISDKTLELYRKNNINIDQYINKIKTNFIKTLRLEYITSLFGDSIYNNTDEKITFNIQNAINFDKTYIQQKFIVNEAKDNYSIFSNKNVSFEDLCFLFCTGFNKYCILALLHLIRKSTSTLYYYTSMTKIQSAECMKSSYNGEEQKIKYFLEHLCLDLKCKKCSNHSEKHQESTAIEKENPLERLLKTIKTQPTVRKNTSIGVTKNVQTPQKESFQTRMDKIKALCRTLKKMYNYFDLKDIKTSNKVLFNNDVKEVNNSLIKDMDLKDILSEVTTIDAPSKASTQTHIDTIYRKILTKYKNTDLFLFDFSYKIDQLKAKKYEIDQQLKNSTGKKKQELQQQQTENELQISAYNQPTTCLTINLIGINDKSIKDYDDGVIINAIQNNITNTCKNNSNLFLYHREVHLYF